MRRPLGRAGFTLVEAVIASSLGLIVVLAMGLIMLAGQRSWDWGRDRAVLQQNAADGLDWMARSVRRARSVRVISPAEFRTFDEAGLLVHTYRRVVGTGPPRLQQDGADLIPRRCNRFVVTPDGDTTSLTLEIEIEDELGNTVAATTRSAVRNRDLTF